MSKYYKAYINPSILPVDCFESDTFEDLKDGFWVDFGLKFTEYPDGRIWIPPSQIIYIKAKLYTLKQWKIKDEFK